jgi:hypothetical protein
MDRASAAGKANRANAAQSVRRRTAGVALAALLAAGGLIGSAPAGLAVEDTRVELTYSISIHGFPVGRAKAETRLAGNKYAMAVSGSVSGIARLFSDASASLVGSGHIQGSRIVPDAYNIVTTEGDEKTHAEMTLRGGAITKLSAEPPQYPAPDRVPVLPAHKRNIVDPLSAFLVVLDKPGIPDGETACNRTIKVFDGWQRYDVRLYYRETKTINGSGDAYKGDVFVCGARYVPVAGHRENIWSVKQMKENERLEIWLAPVGKTQMLAPYRILIGTNSGDLVLVSTRFVVSGEEHRASAN